MVTWEIKEEHCFYLLLLRIPIQYHTSDLVLYRRVQAFNGPVIDRSPLAVATGNDDTVWTLGVHCVENVLHRLLACSICPSWQRIRSQCRSVVDALCGDLVGAEVALQAITGRWADYCSLEIISNGFRLGRRCVLEDSEKGRQKTYHVPGFSTAASKGEQDISASTLAELA